MIKPNFNLIKEFVVNNPWIPNNPFLNQARFLSVPDREALYGGAAGGGKSDALLMAALMFVEIPDYNAILFRKTYTDLALPDAIMDRSLQWLSNTGAKWNGSDYRWTFPSGATLSFGYLAHPKHRYRYQSAQFQFVGFDELTQFDEENYLYLFSRARRLKKFKFVPIRIRGATNPGGEGHEWVYERFLVGEKTFIPSKLTDNPFIDAEEYLKSLSELDETTRKQLVDGLWVLDPHGKPFNRAWYRNFRFNLDRRPECFFRIISIDTALEVKEQNDYTAWVVAELGYDYILRVVKVDREKLTFPEQVDQINYLFNTYNQDGKLKHIIIEGKASGKPAIQSIRSSTQKELARRISEFTPKGSKLERANTAALWCKRGMVWLPIPTEQAQWLPRFEGELFSFPEVKHDDRVDAFSQLIIFLEHFLATGHNKGGKHDKNK